MGDDDKTPVPAAPDYSGITSALSANASLYGNLQSEMYDWAKNAYEQNKDVTDDVVASDLDTQKSLSDFADSTLGRYNDKYRALEDEQIADAESYASGARRDREMGAAQSNVAQQYEAARLSSQRELESYGISPASTRYAALDIGTRSQQAAAEAAAGTTASQNVDATARALRDKAIDTGQEDVTAANKAADSATAAGTAATNASLNTTTSGANTMGTSTQYSTLSNNALGAWGSTLNQGYSNQMSQYNAQNAQDNQPSGWGAALGTAAGIAAKFLAKGGAVDDGDDDGTTGPVYDDNAYYVLPTTDEAGRRLSSEDAIKRYLYTGDHLGVYPNEKAAYAAHGGPMEVLEEASPSSGKAIDDVPARLTVGEMVIPKEVVEYFGRKHFYNLIKKAKEEEEAYKQDTGAVPEEASVAPAEPTFISSGALPGE